MRRRLTKAEWKVIEEEYRAGVIPLLQLCQIYDIDPSVITNRALKKKWIRDLGKTTRRKTNERLTTMVGKVTDEEIVDAAVERNLAVIRKHQASIDQVAKLESNILEELGEDPKKTWVGSYLGEVTTHNVNLSASEKAVALKALASVQATRVALERQLLNLDEADRNAEKLMILLD